MHRISLKFHSVTLYVPQVKRFQY